MGNQPPKERASCPTGQKTSTMAATEPPHKRAKVEGDAGNEAEPWGLKDLIDNTVSVLTNDGRHIVGTLTGFDKVQNIILTSSFERIYSRDTPTETVPLGLYVVRGDSLAVIGEVDPEKDEEVDWEGISADPMPIITHT